MAHRVRTIIPFLNYKELASLLPAEKMFTSKIVECRGGKTPSPTLAKKMGASNYGLFVEQIIEILLNNQCDINILTHIHLPDEYKSYFNPKQYESLANILKEEFSHFEAQVELVDVKNNISGHPDLMTFTTVYDIKTTGRFGSMRIETIFQLLAYFCLSRINNLTINNIGLVLPLQLKIIKYDLSKWQWKPFYTKLIECIQLKNIKESLWQIHHLVKSYFYKQINQYVGFHCHNDDLSKCMKSNVPALQFFVNGNVNGNVIVKNELINALKTPTKSKMFIHAPYILNLSHPGKTDRNDKFEYLEEASYGGWTFDTIVRLLDLGKENRIQGVVVHLGKTCGGNYDEAVFNMYFSLLSLSPWATKECKILIETSCHQNGEILFDPNELCDFYLALPEYVQEVVGICLDTCHVHSAGYKAEEFMKILLNRKVPIELIHYNDSKGECGCKKDRHACIGDGYLGYHMLNEVLQYGIKYNIPMLRE